MTLSSSSPQDNNDRSSHNNNNNNNNEDGGSGHNNNNGSNNNSDSMVSFEEEEEEEEGGESLEELAADGSPPQQNTPSADATLNNNSDSRPQMVRLRSNDSDTNGENFSRRLDICWRDVYEYDSNNEEKIYEDLCYITFSSTLPEVVLLVRLFGLRVPVSSCKLHTLILVPIILNTSNAFG